VALRGRGASPEPAPLDPRVTGARTAESDALSADLKRRGFRFVGSTICYAFMQAVGMIW
jgi:DNA-3-methyladenine glycosylase I